MPNAVWCLLLFFLCLFLNVGCSDDSTTSEIPSDWISDLPSTIEFNVTGGSKEIPLTWSEGVNAALLLVYFLKKTGSGVMQN